jgi:hypothetical protein
MNDPILPDPGAGESSRADTQSALFAQLVLQQTNLALMLLGKTPNPQTGETMRDLDAARLFIDQLEMLETKTKGNLTREEARLLQQSLMTLRLSFVEAVEAPAAPAGGAAGAVPTPAGEHKTAPEDDAGAVEESRKRFSKKY